MNFLRRGSKKNVVKEIHIKTSDTNIKAKRVVVDDESQLNLNTPEPTLCYNSNNLRECLEEAKSELQRLKAENKRLENSMIFLQDKTNYFEEMCNEKEGEILSLNAKIEVLKLQNNEFESEKINKKTKTQNITCAEEELKRVKDEAKKTIRLLQKKMKRLQEKHAKSTQDYALKVFALKDEKTKLIEENEALEDRLRQGTQESRENSGHDDDILCRARNQLVIQLSEQVTSLDVENQELKEELEKTKRLLQKLEPKERRIRTKSIATYELQELCMKRSRIDLASSVPNVERHGRVL